MPAVLGWMSRLDALEVDAEPQPPDRQLAQTEEGGAAGEGDPIVGADPRGQPKVLKSPLKHGKSVHLPGALEGVAAQQVAAREVGDGQRVTVAPIGEHELALVVGTPKIVRPLRSAQRRSFGLVAGPAARGID